MASLVASFPTASPFDHPTEDDPRHYDHQRRAFAPRPISVAMASFGSQGATQYDTRPRSALSGSASPFAPQQRHLRRASSDHDLGGNSPAADRPTLNKAGAQAFDEVVQQPNPWTNPMPYQAFQDFGPGMQQMPYGFPSFGQGHSPPQYPQNFHFNGLLHGGGFAMPPGGASAFAAMSASQAQAWANFQAHSVAWQAMNGGQAHFAQQFGMTSGGQSYGGSMPSVNGGGQARSKEQAQPGGMPQQRSLSAGNNPVNGGAASASATPYHPYRRGPSAGRQTRDREASSSSATSSSAASSRSGKAAPGMSFAPGPAAQGQLRQRSSAQDVRGQGAQERLIDDEQDDALRRPPQPAFANGQTAQRSRESSPSREAARLRVDSAASQTSIGRQVKPGRVPVPPLLGEVVVGPPRQSSAPEQPAHSRQSSSISSVGGPVKPTLEQATSSSSTATTRPPAIDHAELPSDTSSVLTSPARSTGFNTPAQSPTTATSTPSSPPRDWKPSPLSQAEPVVPPAMLSRTSVSAPRTAEEPTPPKSGDKSKGGGFKGRLQRALKKDEKDEKKSQIAVSAPIRAPQAALAKASPPSPSPPQVPPKASLQTASSAPDLQFTTALSAAGDLAVPSRPSNLPPMPVQTLGARRPSNSSFAPSQIEPLDGKAKGKGRSLFNLKNASTDNISISSTVSSASMMIRKMGSLGKLARRNSLAGISKIFKDKKDPEDGVLAEEPSPDGKKPKEKKKRGLFGSKSDSTAAKSTPAVASSQDQAIPGLSPAAQLARQHTLRTKAEEKARAPVQQTFEATNGPSWNTDVLSRPGGEQAAKLPPLGSAIPADAFASSQREQYRPDSPGGDSAQVERDLYDSDEDAFDEDDATVDDVTLRMHDALQMRDSSFDDGARSSYESQEYAAWGQWEPDKFAVPARGILKARSSFGGDSDFAPPAAPWTRTRSNSADGTGAITHEPGPLAKLPASPHSKAIDGVKSAENYDPFSPAFAPFDPPQGEREPLAERLNFPYANAAHNTSAPTLSKMPSNGKLPKTPRAVTAPIQQRKNLNWAPECAVYHTFHASEYDRRSEPATCNRLTPQLAQQIKDELNGYKMEEMDVHPSSRIHTHFFV